MEIYTYKITDRGPCCLITNGQVDRTVNNKIDELKRDYSSVSILSAMYVQVGERANDGEYRFIFQLGNKKKYKRSLWQSVKLFLRANYNLGAAKKNS